MKIWLSVVLFLLILPISECNWKSVDLSSNSTDLLHKHTQSSDSRGISVTTINDTSQATSELLEQTLWCLNNHQPYGYWKQQPSNPFFLIRRVIGTCNTTTKQE